MENRVYSKLKLFEFSPIELNSVESTDLHNKDLGRPVMLYVSMPKNKTI